LPLCFINYKAPACVENEPFFSFFQKLNNVFPNIRACICNTYKLHLASINSMKFLLVFLFSIAASAVFAQQDTSVRTYEKVEIEAEFQEPGGWTNFLQAHLRPNVPVKQHAPAGTYLVVIQFFISKDGSVDGIIPLTNFGYGMEEEVMRVIRKSPKWQPATQNGRPVKAYRKQPITFVVSKKN